MFDGVRGGRGASTPMRRSSMANSTQSLQFRKTVIAKRGELCMHYISASGCALASLCPYRHVGAGARASQQSTQHDGDDGAGLASSSHTTQALAPSPPSCSSAAVVSSMRSPVYASALCPRATTRTIWYWAELPAVTGADRFPQWQPFCAEWRDVLESMYTLALASQMGSGGGGRCDDSNGGGCATRGLQQHGAFWIDFQHMVMRRKDDDGSRRPIQRVHVTPSPTWLIQDITSLCSGATEKNISTSEDGLHTPEVIDAVAASHLEFHYCKGECNMSTIAINGRIVRVNLLTMTAREVRERRSALLDRGSAGAKLRGAVSVAITSARMGGRTTKTTDSGDMLDASRVQPVARGQLTPALPVPPKSGPRVSPRPQDTVGTTPARTYQLLRRPVTVQAGCPPADPYNLQDLRVGITMVSLHTGKPIEVLEGNRRAQQSTNHRGFFVGPARIDVQSLTDDALPPDVCESGSGCRWVSGHHLWTATHHCAFGRAAQCYLCEWQVPPPPMTLPNGEDATGAHPVLPAHRTLLPHMVTTLAERGEAHRALVVHHDAAQHPAMELTAVATWRRHQVISRWFRSEWDADRHSSSLVSAASGDPSFPTASISPRLAGLQHHNDPANGYVALHRVDTRPGSHEMNQLTSMMRCVGATIVPVVPKRKKSLLFEDKSPSYVFPQPVASACSSGGTTPVVSLSPTNAVGADFPSIEHHHVDRSALHTVRRMLTQQLPSYGAVVHDDKADDDDACRGLHVQRVQHALLYSRYLRVRNELFNEWHAAATHGSTTASGQANGGQGTEAEQSREEVLFRYVPRRWLHDILHQEHDDVAINRSTSTTSHHHESDAATGTFCRGRMHFYRDVSSASQERLIPGVPYALLVVVAYPGATIRLATSEAMRLVTPPLVVPWHINDVNEEDQVRMYRPFQAVVCNTTDADGDAGSPLPTPTADDDDKIETTTVLPQQGTSPTADRGGGGAASGTAAASPVHAPASATSTSAVAKKVYLYDPAQWCPMYILAV